MSAPPTKSVTARVLFWLADALYNHRRWFLYPQLVLMALSIYYAITHFDFLSSRDALVGGDKPYHLDYLNFRKEFPAQDDLVVVVESENIEKNRQFVERLGARLDAEPALFTNVLYKFDLKRMGPKALFFLPEKDLKDLLDTLREYQPFLLQFTKATNLISLLDLVNTQFRTARREENEQNKALVKALPALQRIVALAGDAVARPGNPPSPGVTSLFEGGAEAEQEMYIHYGRVFLLTAQSPAEELNERAVGRLRELMSATEVEVPGLNVGLTGEPVLEVDEMQRSERDTTRASIVSLIAVALIFIYGYNETGRPIKATLCLLVGLAYTMGFTFFTVGHLNILTITFVPILIGLAIDFGVHLITRYEEELRRGRSEKYALEKAIVFTGTGIFTGAFTTAGAFFAMAATDFKGIREMGIICGGGMLVCLVPMMTLLPVLLLRGKQNILDHELGPVLDRQAAAEFDRRARIENMWLRRPMIVIGIITGLTILALIPGRKVKFDYNLLHMQSKGLPAVIYQDKLIAASTNRSVLFAAVIADNLQRATNLIDTITNLPTVGSIESMAEPLTEDATRKLALVRDVKQVAAQIHFEPLDQRPVDVEEMDRTLFSLHGYCTLAAKETLDEPMLHTNLLSLREAASDLRSRLRLADTNAASRQLAEFQQALFKDVRDTFDALKNQNDNGGLTAADLPTALRNRFIGVTGKYLIQVYPKTDIWERKEQEEFIKELRTVYPRVTGTPVQLYEYTGLLKLSFEEAARYSLVAIAVLVFIHFRKFSAVILSLLPVGFGTIWLLGIMGVFHIPFNPANIMTLPLLIGIGVTNGIHILNRFEEEQHPSILARSTGKAVLVSGLTAIAGFGSLILAQHRGIKSLGLIMSVGITTCMVVGLTFVPAILNLLSKRGWTIQKTQRDNARSTLGREEPRY